MNITDDQDSLSPLFVQCKPLALFRKSYTESIYAFNGRTPLFPYPIYYFLDVKV